MEHTLRFLFVGDVVGQAGQAVVQKHLPELKKKHAIDAIIVNGENAATKGVGINSKNIAFFRHLGVSLITTGNHVWAQRESYTALNEQSDFIIRPANFHPSCPGKGSAIIDVAGVPVGVINIQGRVFMHQDLECPFRTIESLLLYLSTKTKIIFVDIHAETTSEKTAMGFFLDGKVSGVVGTHTHIQTADERILPKGTAYITDLGCCAALNSTLGVKKEVVIQRFLTQMPQQFSVEKTGPFALHGVIIDVDTSTGKATHIERVKVVDEDIHKQLAPAKV